MPIAMIASLVICTIVYILVAMVLTGLVKWTELGTAEPLATAFRRWACTGGGIISLGRSLRPRRCWWYSSWASRASSSPWRATACCRPGLESAPEVPHAARDHHPDGRVVASSPRS